MSEENIKQEQAAAPAEAPVADAPVAEGDSPAKKARPGKSIPAGIAFIRSTFNNTQVSIADARGGVIAWSSAGRRASRAADRKSVV